MNWGKKVLILAFFLIYLSACQSREHHSGWKAEVQRIVSGQTLEVIIPEQNNLRQQVRLIGISAPDLQQSPWGEAAQKRLKELITQSQTKRSLSSSVVLETEVSQVDRCGRLWAHVWHNGTLVNEQLVKEGYVLADLDYPHKYTQKLEYAQEYARLMGYGIWNPEQPMRLTPAQFRSQSTQE
jgi:micrococcal nuclease